MVVAATKQDPPTVFSLFEGELMRGAESPGLRSLLQVYAIDLGEHTMFQVGDSSYFPLVRSDFSLTVIPDGRTLIIQLREHDITVVPLPTR